MRGGRLRQVLGWRVPMGTRNSAVGIQSQLAEAGCQQAPRGRCEHRWLVATPKGTATSLGVCRRCGRRKRFANALEDILNRDTLDVPGSRGQAARALVKGSVWPRRA